MKIFLDNCVPYRAKQLFPGHELRHARDAGLERLKNGELLSAAAQWADVFVTTDKQFRHQQHIGSLPLPVIELNSRLTRFVDLQALAPYFETALKMITTARFISIDTQGQFELLN